NIAGLDNLLLLESGDADPMPLLMLAAVPTRYGAHRGVHFCGAAARHGVDGDALLSNLMADCVRAYAANGCEFALATPQSAQTAARLEELEFRNHFPRRMLRMPIARNLLAQAEFDTMTVHRLMQTRHRYQPGAIFVEERALAEMVTQLYRRGMTMVSNRRGYGLYYTGGSSLQFLELQADNDHCADVLLQAAAEKTGIHRAQVILAENQSLYLGAGRRCGYGMIRFLGKTFPVSDLFFGLLL
ncbi:MAG: hypothetical protein ACI4OI_02605, partial [Gemmiger sp.]